MTKPAIGHEDWLLQFFAHAHLPPDLAAVSRPFAELAAVVAELPRNPERTVALRKLLESKDCAVRAVVAEKNRRLLPDIGDEPITTVEPKGTVT